MKSILKPIALVLLIASLLSAQFALADSITFTGTVAASKTYEVYAPIGGKVSSVAGEVGQNVLADDVLVSLSTTKVYAEEDGTVTGVFGQPGDSAETIASLYGAVISIEGGSVYTIAASTENAYNSAETKFVHVGESVYLSCYSDGKHTGTGVITAVEGTSYTVRVDFGEFLVGETVNVYRGFTTASSMRIGRGTLSRTAPTAVTGSGSIVSIAVSPGSHVRRGDLLFETLDGTFDGLYMSGSDIPAGIDGTISQINVQQGASIQKGDVVAVLYPAGAMRIEASVEEANLGAIAVGTPVTIELLWNQDEEVTYSGVISGISAIADEPEKDSQQQEQEDTAVTYTVTIDFTPDENTRYGMSAIVTTLSAEDTVGNDEDVPEEAPLEESEGVTDDAQP